MAGNWYDDRRNLALLLSYMADDGFDTSELIRAVEKPWCYDHEFDQAWRRRPGAWRPVEDLRGVPTPLGSQL